MYKPPMTMKYLLLFLPFIYSPMLLNGQTGDEILLMTQQRYRTLDNYIDQSFAITDSYNNPPHVDTATYFVAIDRNKNVAHWCTSYFMGRTQGAKYFKVASDSLGTFTRLGYGEPPFLCSFEEAQGRLGATGRGILLTIGSLMFDNISDGPGDSSVILKYDNATRLNDTIHQGEKCYVVKTEKTVIITKESLDARQHRSDSIYGLLDLPKEQRASIPVGKAGNHFSTCSYTIRCRDSMIVQMEKYHFGVYETVQHKLTIMMDPIYNEKEFYEYMKEN